MLGEGGRYSLAVELQATIESQSIEETTALMQAAHAICPYSNATRGNIEVVLIAGQAEDLRTNAFSPGNDANERT